MRIVCFENHLNKFSIYFYYDPSTTYRQSTLLMNSFTPLRHTHLPSTTIRRHIFLMKAFIFPPFEPFRNEKSLEKPPSQGAAKNEDKRFSANRFPLYS